MPNDTLFCLTAFVPQMSFYKKIRKLYIKTAKIKFQHIVMKKEALLTHRIKAFAGGGGKDMKND